MGLRQESRSDRAAIRKALLRESSRAEQSRPTISVDKHPRGSHCCWGTAGTRPLRLTDDSNVEGRMWVKGRFGRISDSLEPCTHTHRHTDEHGSEDEKIRNLNNKHTKINWPGSIFYRHDLKGAEITSYARESQPSSSNIPAFHSIRIL